jgi:PAS domain S-box-containing protein
MKFLKNRLSSIVLVSVLVISIFTLFFAASISYKQIKTLTETEKLVVHSYKIYVELEQLGLYTKDAESGQLGYILTKDPDFLHPYYEAIGKINKSFIRLKSLTAGNPGPYSGLDTLIMLINRRFIHPDSVVMGNHFKLNSTGTVKQFVEKGRAEMLSIQAQIDKMVSYEMQLLKNRETEHDNDLKLSPFSILFIVLFSLFVFIVSFNKINKDLKGLAKTNNQLMINNEIFEHSEQIADISHWYWNIEEDNMIYSNNLYRLLGCNSNDIEPAIGNFLEFVYPDDRHLVTEGNMRTLKEMEPTITHFRVIRKDGAIRYFKSIGKLITDNYGTNFSIGINADITEEYLKDKLIKEKLADLERSNKQLTAFNHIASHDLQEPLRKVQTFISRIKDKDFEQLPEKVKEYLSGIEKANSRMQKFIEDLLLYSQANRADKTLEPCDLNEILEISKRELSQRIEEKNVIINCTTALPVANVIPFQIQQLFINILSNSIKYAKPDINPVINIDSDVVEANEIPGCSDQPESKYYRISFSDNGIGFDQQYAGKIFTPFFRLHTNRQYSGTGIGLSICKIIIENHKGFIVAKGVPQAGTTFTIYLPV